MSKSPRVRYFPGPQVWALAQDAYLAGESAASIAGRLGLTVNGIRKRAARKGWTRTQAAEALERSRDPILAVREMLARIGPLVQAGRMDEAFKLIQSATMMARTARTTPDPEPARVEPDRKTMQAWRAAESRRLEAEWEARAHRMARDLLTDPGYLYCDNWAIGAFRWRAEHLGPEQAAQDFAKGVSGGWASRYWDEEGRLWPPRIPSTASGKMQKQHLAGCAAHRQGLQDETELPD